MFWFRWLGALTAGLSLYKVASTLLLEQVGFVMEHLIGYYKAIFYPAANAINALIGWLLPNFHIQNDFLVMYLICGLAFIRFDIYSSTAEGLAASPDYIRIPSAAAKARDADTVDWKRRVYPVAAPIVYIVTWPLVFVLFAVMAFEAGNVGCWAKRILRYLSVGMSKELARAGIFFVFFIVLNAGTPSLF